MSGSIRDSVIATLDEQGIYCGTCENEPGDFAVNCDLCKTTLTSAADAVIASLGLREVFTIAWDGQPSMSGGGHRVGLSSETTREEAIANLSTLTDLPGWAERHPNSRIERRLASSWQRDSPTAAAESRVVS